MIYFVPSGLLWHSGRCIYLLQNMSPWRVASPAAASCYTTISGCDNKSSLSCNDTWTVLGQVRSITTWQARWNVRHTTTRRLQCGLKFKLNFKFMAWIRCSYPRPISSLFQNVLVVYIWFQQHLCFLSHDSQHLTASWSVDRRSFKLEELREIRRSLQFVAQTWSDNIVVICILIREAQDAISFCTRRSYSHHRGLRYQHH